MSFDTQDREKIEQRTRPDPSGSDYRLELRGKQPGSPFSFLVVGDSGSASRAKSAVADAMWENEHDFLLHLGDLVYLSGSKEGYPARFIEPYRKWLLRGVDHRYDDMVFSRAVLPIPGNHDYYDFNDAIDGIPLVSFVGKFIVELLDEVGLGSGNGRVYEDAFVAANLDGLQGGPLSYVAGQQTRVPNRYYWFTYGNCAFYALDSNTLDGGRPPTEAEAARARAELVIAEDEEGKARARFDSLRSKVERPPMKTGGPSLHKAHRHRKEIAGAAEQLADAKKRVVDLKKYLMTDPSDHDQRQLDWLRRVLAHDDARDKWKIVYMHHSLYSSEENHTSDPQSVGLRDNLREIFASGAVHLVLSGHSHCFEWVGSTHDSGSARDNDRNICYVVTGGGGRGLHRSILDPASRERDRLKKQARFLSVARSQAFASLLDDQPELFSYLLVQAGADELKVRPVGVAADRKPSNVTPIPVQVFGDDGTAGVVNDQLDCIQIFRDRAPRRGVW